MADISALLLVVSVGYWAVLVYPPVFLGPGFGWTAEAVGLAMLRRHALHARHAALRPSPRNPLGKWRLFASALTLVASGGPSQWRRLLKEPAMPALGWAFVGMTLIGSGAALSHP